MRDFEVKIFAKCEKDPFERLWTLQVVHEEGTLKYRQMHHQKSTASFWVPGPPGTSVLLKFYISSPFEYSGWLQVGRITRVFYKIDEGNPAEAYIEEV